MTERLFLVSFNLPKLLKEIETAVLETGAAATSSDIEGKEELMKVMKLLLNARSQIIGDMSRSFESADFTECAESADCTGNIISDKVQEIADCFSKWEEEEQKKHRKIKVYPSVTSSPSCELWLKACYRHYTHAILTSVSV